MNSASILLSQLASSPVPFEVLNTTNGGFVPLFLSAGDSPGALVSMNAGNSNQFFVGGAGLNQAFAGAIASPSSYAALQMSLYNAAVSQREFSDTYSAADPIAAALVQKPFSSQSFHNYEGTVFIDVFQAGKNPAGNPDNFGMIYVCPPDGSGYAALGDFLTAVESTAGNVIQAIRYFNQQLVPAHPNLRKIEILRAFLFSSDRYRQASATLAQVAESVCQGMLDALNQGGATGLTKIELPNGTGDFDSIINAGGGGKLSSRTVVGSPPPQPASAAPNATPGGSGSLGAPPIAGDPLADVGMEGISANDWDTVFAIKFAVLNQAIVDAKASPPRFSGVYLDPINNISYAATGDFGAWQLGKGGSDADVNLSIPISNVQFAGKTFSGTASVQVRLVFEPDVGGGSMRRLRVKTTSSNEADEPVAVVQDLTINEANAAGLAPEVSSVLDGWLNANMGQFGFVFATVDMGMTASMPNFQWLNPTSIAYAVVDQPGAASSGSDSLLGVLAMTSGRANPNPIQQISPAAVLSGCEAGLLISANRFLAHFVVPGVKLIFDGASSSDFSLSNDGATITNKRELIFPGLELGNGDVIQGAKVAAGNFELTLFRDTLRITFTAITFEWQTGYEVALNYVGVATVAVGADGTLRMNVETPTLSYAVTQSFESEVESVFIGVAIGVVVAVISSALFLGLGPVFKTAVGTALESAAQRLIATAARTGLRIGATVAPETVEGVEMAAVGAGEAGARTIGNTGAEAQAAAGDATAAVAGEARVISIAGFFQNNWRELFGVVAATVTGGVVSQAPTWIYQAKEKAALDDVPGLGGFPSLGALTGDATAAIQWTGVGGFTVANGQLNGVLQIGLTRTTLSPR